MRSGLSMLALLGLMQPAWADPPPRVQRAQAPAPPAVAPPAVATPTEPQRTTATFGDWTLRCMLPDPGAKLCDVTQTVFDKAQPVAQTAFGRAKPGEVTRLTMLVPPSVTLATRPRLPGLDQEPALELTWQRCLPAGCLADIALTDEQLRRLRARTDTTRILFQDGAGREAAIPFAPTGLSQALDALAKSETSAR